MEKLLTHLGRELMNMSSWLCVGKRLVGGNIKAESACKLYLFSAS